MMLRCLLGVLCFSSCSLLLNLLVCTQVAYENTVCATTKLDHLEWKNVTCYCSLTVFLNEFTVKAESLYISRKSDVSSLVRSGNYLTLYYCSYREVLLNLIPRVRGKLLVTKTQSVVSLVEVEDNDLDRITYGYHL